VSSAAGDQRSRWLTLGVIAICVAVSLVAGLAWRPAPTPLPATQSGDAGLADLGRRIVGEDRPALTVACVTPTAIRTTAMGAEHTDRFEIGSISKGLTGLLFADMIERGEVRADTRLGELLPVSNELSQVRLSQLATHTSGLPPQLPTLRQYGKNYWATLTAGNPYDGTVQQRLDALADVQLDEPPGAYSNLAYELLGAALAAAADRPYRDLLRERILRPVGLTEASIPYADSELTDRDLLGQTTGGRTNDAWLGEAMAPAGGVRAGIDEMALFSQRLLTKQAPGMDALEPKVTEQDESTGWAWVTMPSPTDQRTITWHNGGTGGFTAFLGLDREREVGVVILSAKGETPNHVTLTGFQLLHEVGDCT
jgi:CubicO group peptidase (beta-lactamase class C family)